MRASGGVPQIRKYLDNLKLLDAGCLENLSKFKFLKK